MHVIQTIRPAAAAQLCGARFRIHTPGGDVVASLCELDANGDPTAVLDSQPIARAAITSGAWHQISWPPLYVEADAALALVIEAGDTSTALGVAQIGRKDPDTGTYATAMSGELGTLFTANAGTKAEQTGTVLALQLLTASYPNATHTVDLGTVDLDGATDLAVVAAIVKPEAGADAHFIITTEDGQHVVDNEQRIELLAAYTGTANVQAVLQRGTTMAPVLQPATVLITGSMSPSADYISGVMEMAGGTTLRVDFDALLPSGASVAVQYQPATGGAWQAVPYVENSGASAGFVTITHELAGISAPRIRLRLLLTGTPAARPLITNLRAVSL